MKDIWPDFTNQYQEIETKVKNVRSITQADRRWDWIERGWRNLAFTVRAVAKEAIRAMREFRK